jgi:CIC family chloride channel protein
MLLPKSKYNSKKNNVCPNCNQFVNCWFRRFSGFRKLITGAAFGSNYAQKYKLSYKDRTLLIGCGVAAGIAAAFAPIPGFICYRVLLVDVSIAAFTPIMIAAATLVSVIALDEEILLSFKQQQSFDYHNIIFY